MNGEAISSVVPQLKGSVTKRSGIVGGQVVTNYTKNMVGRGDGKDLGEGRCSLVSKLI